MAITSGALTMAQGIKTAAILVTILEEQEPELSKVFFVNITSVARLPIDGTQGESSYGDRNYIGLVTSGYYFNTEIFFIILNYDCCSCFCRQEPQTQFQVPCL